MSASHPSWDALRESEERLRLAVEAAGLGMWDWDLRTGQVVWNDAHFRLQGYTAGEVAPSYEAWLERIHPDDRSAAAEAVSTALNSHADYQHEFRSLRPDGFIRWFATRGLLIRDDDGSPIRMIGVMRDVTDRREHEAALRRSEEELRLANDTLEQKVQQRTAELMQALESLRTEGDLRRELTLRLATLQEDERKRIARDLHDGVGQALVGLRLALSRTQKSGFESIAEDWLKEVVGQVDAMVEQVRGLTVRLRPTPLDDIGLAAAIEEHASSWSAGTGVQAEVYLPALEGRRLPPEVETALFRIVQEGLTNVANHSGATRVGIALAATARSIVLTVEDDGRGFDPDSVEKGRWGLTGMRERLALIGGELEIETSPGAGATIIARLPLMAR